ncbi:hypothetical protein CRYO30217_03351 [Parvicella tangerina]|uniref:Lipocalin-like domain-containing protein n=2 Tax=Parvicella tangerina TaxID=2829795 RepID=A0A916JSF3_9FLAO|nr:hypothetical protein CRYO30217_03351 [Parvicella tangerina]
MIKMIKYFLLLFVGVSLLSSCNKEERYSKRWMQKEVMSGEWQVSEITVDGVSETVIPTLRIDDCDIYADTCTGQWITGDNSADFIWQFQDKGKEFVLYRRDGADCCDFITDISEIQCYNYSGNYEVIKAKKKEMSFESNTTVGYEGSTVKLVLTRKE